MVHHVPWLKSAGIEDIINAIHIAGVMCKFLLIFTEPLSFDRIQFNHWPRAFAAHPKKPVAN